VTTAHTQRRHGFIVGSTTDDRGNVASVLVKCPWCRGVHRHSLRGTADFGRPWCGVPGVVYQLRWPIDGANTAAGSVGSNG
jgi:hypothetical protein